MTFYYSTFISLANLPVAQESLLNVTIIHIPYLIVAIKLLVVLELPDIHYKNIDENNNAGYF